MNRPPFHLVFPVHDTDEARSLYLGILGCAEGCGDDRSWQVCDFMLELHILVPHRREDTSYPLLIILAALSVIAALLETVLMVRKRRRPSSAHRNG